MNILCQNSDRSSALPQDTIEKILTVMPIRDALRTSVLSKKWRNCWTSMPKVVFDDNLVSLFLSDNDEFHNHKFFNAIFHVLLLHKGPISELIICMSDTQIFNEFDHIILYLSRSDSIKKFTFVELFKCLPLVKEFAASDMPLKLPTSLVHLRILVLDVCFHELSFALCVINSSPNLEKIKMEMCWNHSRCAQQAFKNVFDLQGYSGLKLDHLKELEITRCNISALEMTFVKLIMAKSPLLKKARIELDTDVSHDEEVQMFRDLLLLPFPRASPLAKFIIERPKKYL